MWSCESFGRGRGGNRTRVQGFAGPCLSHSATRPGPGNRYQRETPEGAIRADDGIRTRDPNLGKVVLYQLSHVRVPARRFRPAQQGRTLAEEGVAAQVSGSAQSSNASSASTSTCWLSAPV